MPTQSEIIKFYDGFSKRLKKDFDSPNKRHLAFKEVVKKYVNPGVKCLDVGCGVGITTKMIAEAGGEVVGLDISPKNIEIAKTKSSHKNAKYLNQDILKSNLKAQEYDIIFIEDCFEHIQPGKIIYFLNKIGEWAKEKVHINVPDARFQSWMQENRANELQIVDEAYSVSKMITLFSGIGFELANIKIYGLDVVCQYNEYLFVRSGWLEKAYGVIDG